MSSYATIGVKLRAVIGQFEFDDVVQYAAEFAGNVIPQASIRVALGRNVRDNTVATIHRALGGLGQPQKAEVFLRCDVLSEENAIAGVPNGVEVKIFEGETAGIGFVRNAGAAQFTINLIHWLDDIDSTSAISASSHPSNPADLTYPAIFRSLGGPTVGGAAGANPAWVPVVDESLVSVAALEDIWGKVLLPWMESVAQADPFEMVLSDGDGRGDPKILELLKRMAPNAEGKPLALNYDGANGVLVAEGIRQALMNETGGNWVNTTMWGKLIGEWAPAYWFTVVPRVTDALIVPFTGGLRGEPWAVITAQDEESLNISEAIDSRLRAVGILHGTMYASGIDGGKGSISLDRGGFAGIYGPDGKKNGKILVKEPPKWLMDPMMPFEFSLCAQGVDDKEVGTTVDEVAGDDCEQDRDLAKDQAGHRSVMNRYAQQWYALESLKDRVGEVPGKLRFDIAPASNVRVDIPGGVNILDDGLAVSLFASVMKVAYFIDAESQIAVTTYSLAHMRTAVENTQDSTSVEKPPLYREAWVGAPLVKV